MIHKLDFNRITNVEHYEDGYSFQYAPKNSHNLVSMTVEPSLMGLTVWLEVTMEGEMVFGDYMSDSKKDFKEIHIAYIKFDARKKWLEAQSQRDKRSAVDQICKDEGFTD
mgnify:CR=1 FL=1